MNEDTQTTGTSAPDNSDTVENQASEASVQTNNETPEAPQSTESSDVKAEDTVEEKLYAGKYKSAEEMEKAYTELQSKATRDSQEKAELTRILNEAFATPVTTTVPDTASEDFEETTTVNPVVEQLQQDNAVVKFIMGHQDADGETMGKVLAEDPMVKQITGYEAKLEYAYLRSQNMGQAKAIAEAKKSAQVATQVKTAEKQAAQVESAQKTEPINEDSDLMDKATGNHPQEVRDAARLAIIRKNLVNL